MAKILANTKAQRWSKLAFILTIRKQVMEQINHYGDDFHWNGELDLNCCIDAKKLIDMNDYYIVALALIPVSNKGKRSGYVTPKSDASSNTLDQHQQMQLLKHELRIKIIDIILRETNAINGFQISTAELTKKIPRKRFKNCSNMDNIRFIIDEFQNAHLLTATDPANKKTKNTRYSKIIIRNQLSTLSLNDEDKKKIKKIFVKYGLLALLSSWAAGWGPEEVLYIQSIANIQI